MDHKNKDTDLQSLNDIVKDINWIVILYYKFLILLEKENCKLKILQCVVRLQWSCSIVTAGEMCFCLRSDGKSGERGEKMSWFA